MTASTVTIQDRTNEASALITDWAAEAPQTLVPRKLVIDRLLDLRNIVTADRRAEVDAILTAVPGVTVVEGHWWAAQLATLAIGFDAHAAGEPR